MRTSKKQLSAISLELTAFCSVEFGTAVGVSHRFWFNANQFNAHMLRDSIILSGEALAGLS
jgi:hypothetical protein